MKDEIIDNRIDKIIDKRNCTLFGDLDVLSLVRISPLN
jgi:hypothetical protein